MHSNKHRKLTGKGQFEETRHDHDVSSNVLLLTYQKINLYKGGKIIVTIQKNYLKANVMKLKKTMETKPLTKC